MLQVDSLPAEPQGKPNLFIQQTFIELPTSCQAREDLLWTNQADNHNGVITHLELDILECEVKWALESITMNEASGGDGIPVELFQILKDDSVKVLHLICQKIWKTQQWPQDRKRSMLIPIPKKGNAKNVQTNTQWHSSHMLLKWCSKFSKPGFSNTWTENFQMFKLVLEKAEELEIKLPTSTGSSKKQESSRKTSISDLLNIPKHLTVWVTINCGKFWKRWEYQTTWPASWETCMQVMKQQLQLDMEQQTDPNREMSMSRLHIVTLLI